MLPNGVGQTRIAVVSGVVEAGDAGLLVAATVDSTAGFSRPASVGSRQEPGILNFWIPGSSDPGDKDHRAGDLSLGIESPVRLNQVDRMAGIQSNGTPRWGRMQ